MILESQQLVEIYEAVIKPFGHPDPLGYMTRSLLTSQGDPEYVDVKGKQGFLPVIPSVASDLTGATEVQSLQGNLIATLSMDRIFFDQYGTVDNMIIAFHFGERALTTSVTSEQKQFIDDVNEARSETLEIMYPPFATVNDVIDLLNPSEVDDRLTKKEEDFFKFLLKQT